MDRNKFSNQQKKKLYLSSRRSFKALSLLLIPILKMKRKEQSICWFLPRLLLIYNQHFSNHFTVHANERKLEEQRSFNEESHNNKNLNDRMREMEACSNRQENEIGTLKTTVSEDRKRINDLEGRIAVLESSSVITGTTKLGRQKQPASLLPDNILLKYLLKM